MQLLNLSVLDFWAVFVGLAIIYFVLKTYELLKFVNKDVMSLASFYDRYNSIVFHSHSGEAMARNQFINCFPNYRIEQFSRIKDELNGLTSYYVKYKSI